MTACTYCGADVTRHAPIVVRSYEGDARRGPFCNYGCLAAHIEAADLAVGTACEWDPANG